MSAEVELTPGRGTDAAGPHHDPWPEFLRTPAGAEMTFRRKVGRNVARYGFTDPRRGTDGVTVVRKGEGPNTRYLRAERAARPPVAT